MKAAAADLMRRPRTSSHRAMAAAARAHPMDPLTAAQLGAALGGLSEAAVLKREREGALFSVRRTARANAPEYPAFQAWPEVAGAPIKHVMQALAPLGATDLYGFFAAPTDLLGGLAPIEALNGERAWNRWLGSEARMLLRSSMRVRLQAVLHAAGALVALRAA